MNYKHKGKVLKGQFKPYSQDNWQIALDKLQDQEVVVTIRKPQSKRSENLNKYYWGVVIKILSDELGYLPLQMHEVLQVEISPTFSYFSKSKNKEVIVRDRTHNKSTKWFMEMIERARAWATEQGVYIPLPNEVDYNY